MVYDLNDGVDHMRFMVAAKRIRFDAKFPPSMNWMEAKYSIEKWCSEQLQGQYRVMLGKEDNISDTSANFVVYCIDENDAVLVKMKYKGEIT